MRHADTVSEPIHAELLASVFATIVPPLIMSGLLGLFGALAAVRIPDAMLRGLFAAAGLAAIARLAVTFHDRRTMRRRPLAPGVARRVERRFAAAYLAFALFFGLFAARVMAVAPPQLATIGAVLVVGYAAGVSTGVAARPFISVPSIVLGVAPTILVAAVRGTVEDGLLAFILFGLLAGGLRSTLVRYRAATREIAMRQSFAILARSDPLTGLPNRLGLTERLDELAQGGKGATLYCIDLDDFKPVNDRHGHAVGDAVLVEAAARLRELLCPGDLVARVGGDEFVLVQAAGAGDSDAFAMHAVLALSEPYRAAGELVSVGASVGTAPLLPGEAAEQALGRADGALYRSKRFRQTSEVPEVVRPLEHRAPRRRRGPRRV